MLFRVLIILIMCVVLTAYVTRAIDGAHHKAHSKCTVRLKYVTPVCLVSAGGPWKYWMLQLAAAGALIALLWCVRVFFFNGFGCCLAGECSELIVCHVLH